MCGIIGVLDKRRQTVDGAKIKEALSMMNERGSGEGDGYVAYGSILNTGIISLCMFFLIISVKTRRHLILCSRNGELLSMMNRSKRMSSPISGKFILPGVIFSVLTGA